MNESTFKELSIQVSSENVRGAHDEFADFFRSGI